MRGNFLFSLVGSIVVNFYSIMISPGRFFAANEIKGLLAHIVVTYDIKFEEGKQAPRGVHFNAIRIPGEANAMFRKRQR